MLRSTKVRNQAAYQVTFVLPAEVPDGPVSVVGTFNGWTPGLHVLKPQRNGTRAVSIRLPAGRPVRFRYLADGGAWFDDPDVPDRDGEDCLIRL